MILDTNALSAFVDGVPAIAAALDDARHIAIPVVVLGEYRYGINHSAKRRQYEDWLHRYLHAFRILSITEDTAFEYASIRSELRQSGKPIPAMRLATFFGPFRPFNLAHPVC